MLEGATQFLGTYGNKENPFGFGPSTNLKRVLVVFSFSLNRITSFTRSLFQFFFKLHRELL